MERGDVNKMDSTERGREVKLLDLDFPDLLEFAFFGSA
jgi:hypothetical protein